MSVEEQGRPATATKPVGLDFAAMQRSRIQKPCAAKEHRRSAGSFSQSFQKNLLHGLAMFIWRTLEARMVLRSDRNAQ
jgi:hypothetical protein